MEAAFLLCDAAQVASDGKVYILGAGWRVIGPQMPPHAVVALITLEAHELGVVHDMRLELVDEDGHTVTVSTPQGTLKIGAQGHLRGEAAPDAPPHRVVDVPFVAPIGPGLPLKPGGTYVWQLWINGDTRDDWRCTFYVRDASEIQ